MLPTELIKKRGEELGLRVGVCAVQPPPHHPAYAAWLAKGYHGEMEYLRAHLEAKQSPRSLLPGCQSIVAAALNYNQDNPKVQGQPQIARYALGRDYHKVLRGKLKLLTERIAPGASNRICVDSAPLMERDYANLAGLGWFGKNTCLIDSKQGSWFVLGFILTTATYQPDTPAGGGCGTCQKCIDACPTGAIVFEEERWQVRGDRCISYLTIEKRGELPPDANLAGWSFGCDVCQEVCPFNQPRPGQPLRAAATVEPDFLLVRQWPALQELADLDAAQWDMLTRGSPVRRAGLDGMRRNARENLGRTHSG